MTVSCPACGTEIDVEGAKPGSELSCPECGRSLLPDPPAVEELAISEQDESRPANGEAAPGGAAEGLVTCPICRTANPALAKVCAHCGAILRRKHWPETTGVPATTAALPVKRRHLTLLLLFAIAIGLVGLVAWMAGRLLVAVETPSVAYKRMAGMAANGDWNRFCDRVYPTTQRHLVAMAQGEPGAPASLKQMFAKEGFGQTFMAISGLPIKDFSITGEKIDDDHAMLDLKCADGRLEIVHLSKDQGIWKLRLPDVEGPEK